MPGKLILDPSEPGVNEVVAGMTVGEPTVLREITVIPTLISETTVEGEIVGINIEQEEGGAVGTPIEAGAPGGPPAPEDKELMKMPMENEGGYDQGQL